MQVRRHGESAAIIEVLTDSHGRHAGVVRGGASRKMAPVLQPGAQLDLTWSARLEDHLGAFVVEPLRSRAGLMADPLALCGLNAVAAVLLRQLPERQAQPGLYARTVTLCDLMAQTDAWPLAYLQWEMALLESLGAGLELGSCAATGATEGLAYVSPKSGRAVSQAGAGDWAPRLLPLPPVMLGQGAGDNSEIALALGTTGHFLEKLNEAPLPPARDRLIERLSR